MSGIENLPAVNIAAFPGAGLQRGMTLRDWIAGQALPWALGLHYGNDCGTTGEENARLAAQYAYKIADAMLAERQKGGAA